MTSRSCALCGREWLGTAPGDDAAEVLALWRRLNVLAETNTDAADVVNAYRSAFRGFKPDDLLPGGATPGLIR